MLVPSTICGHFPPCCLRRREYGAPASLFPFVSMWSLPSLLSPSEGIWSARVSPAPLFPFVSMWSLPSSASPPASRFAVIANKQETPIKEYPEEAHDLSGSFRKVV